MFERIDGRIDINKELQDGNINLMKKNNVVREQINFGLIIMNICIKMFTMKPMKTMQN